MRYTLIAIIFLGIPLFASAHTYGSDILTAHVTTSTADSQDPAHTVDKTYDDNTATFWVSGAGYPHWIKYDLGSTTAAMGKISVTKGDADYMKTVCVLHSDDGSAYTTSSCGLVMPDTLDVTETLITDFTDTHRYWQFYFPDSYNSALYAMAREIEMYECTDCNATSTATTTEARYTLITLLVIAGFIGADFVRRLFAGKFGKKLPFA